MKKFKNESGYTVYECDVTEIRAMFGKTNCICDDCGVEQFEDGYLIPCRNVFLCILCYKDFCQKHPSYSEADRATEEHIIAYYEDLASKNKVIIETA